MEYFCLMCSAVCCVLSTLGLIAEARLKRRRTETFLKLTKGYEIMKKEALEPYIGRDIVVKDLFGATTRGTLESVSDESTVLVRGGKKTAVVATEYVASFEVSENK